MRNTFQILILLFVLLIGVLFFIDTTRAATAAYTQIINVTDNTTPVVNITEPLDGYNSLARNVSINFTATDTALQSCWYVIDNNITNVSISCNLNFSIFFESGDRIFTIYANDTSNNRGSHRITLTVAFPEEIIRSSSRDVLIPAPPLKPAEEEAAVIIAGIVRTTRLSILETTKNLVSKLNGVTEIISPFETGEIIYLPNWLLFFIVFASVMVSVSAIFKYGFRYDFASLSAGFVSASTLSVVLLIIL